MASAELLLASHNAKDPLTALDAIAQAEAGTDAVFVLKATPLFLGEIISTQIAGAVGRTLISPTFEIERGLIYVCGKLDGEISHAEKPAQ